MQLTPGEMASEESRSAAARARSTLILIIAFWAFAVLMLSIRALLVDTAPLSVLGPRRLAVAIVGTILCLGTAQLLQALRSRSFAGRIVVGVAPRPPEAPPHRGARRARLWWRATQRWRQAGASCEQRTLVSP